MSTEFFPAGDQPAITVKLAEYIRNKGCVHNYYELVYITGGFGLHEAPGGSKLVSEGDLMLLCPGQYYRFISKTLVTRFSCCFRESAIDASLRKLSFLHLGVKASFPLLHLPLAERKYFLFLLNEMANETDKREFGWDTKLQNTLNTLIIEFARIVFSNLDNHEKCQVYPNHVATALEYIHAHYAQDISINNLANGANISRSYLTRQFHEVTGVTPLYYLKKYRFARAMEYLQSGASVTEIANDVGFQSLSHFSREFKKELGVSPTEYRSQNSTKGEPFYDRS